MAMAAMAFTLKPKTNGALVLVLCLLILEGVSGCFPGHGCHRKLQMVQVQGDGLKENNNIVVHYGSTSSSGNRESSMREELRTVPSGPDPMHHKKPRSDP